MMTKVLKHMVLAYVSPCMESGRLGSGAVCLDAVIRGFGREPATVFVAHLLLNGLVLLYRDLDILPLDDVLLGCRRHVPGHLDYASEVPEPERQSLRVVHAPRDVPGLVQHQHHGFPIRMRDLPVLDYLLRDE